MAKSERAANRDAESKARLAFLYQEEQNSTALCNGRNSIPEGYGWVFFHSYLGGLDVANRNYDCALAGLPWTPIVSENVFSAAMDYLALYDKRLTGGLHQGRCEVLVHEGGADIYKVVEIFIRLEVKLTPGKVVDTRRMLNEL